VERDRRASGACPRSAARPEAALSHVEKVLTKLGEPRNGRSIRGLVSAEMDRVSRSRQAAPGERKNVARDDQIERSSSGSGMPDALRASKEPSESEGELFASAGGGV
jgi:hypothetical protein